MIEYSYLWIVFDQNYETGRLYIWNMDACMYRYGLISGNEQWVIWLCLFTNKHMAGGAADYFLISRGPLPINY